MDNTPNSIRKNREQAYFAKLNQAEEHRYSQEQARCRTLQERLEEIAADNGFSKSDFRVSYNDMLGTVSLNTPVGSDTGPFIQGVLVGAGCKHNLKLRRIKSEHYHEYDVHFESVNDLAKCVNALITEPTKKVDVMSEAELTAGYASH